MLDRYWALSPAEVLAALSCSAEGISSREGERRLALYGRNDLHGRDAFSRLRLLWAQVKSPLQLLLVFAAAASALTGEWTDAGIILTIIVASSGIGYAREYKSNVAAAAL